MTSHMTQNAVNDFSVQFSDMYCNLYNTQYTYIPYEKELNMLQRLCHVKHTYPICPTKYTLYTIIIQPERI